MSRPPPGEGISISTLEGVDPAMISAVMAEDDYVWLQMARDGRNGNSGSSVVSLVLPAMSAVTLARFLLRCAGEDK